MDQLTIPLYTSEDEYRQDNVIFASLAETVDRLYQLKTGTTPKPDYLSVTLLCKLSLDDNLLLGKYIFRTHSILTATYANRRTHDRKGWLCFKLTKGEKELTVEYVK